MSVTFTGYMWTAVPSCAQNSPLLLQCHLWFGALRQKHFSQAMCVSWVRLAWNSTVPEAWRQTWSQWRNMVLPSPTWQTPSVLCQWQSQGACLKLWDSISWEMTLLQHTLSLECFYFLLRYMKHITGKLYISSYIIRKRMSTFIWLICIELNH